VTILIGLNCFVVGFLVWSHIGVGWVRIMRIALRLYW
jgi:Predicted P-loop ATPase and inactivated derivatives